MQAIVKELSERELAALSAVIRAVDYSVSSPVYTTFVRNFRAGRITKSGSLELCGVRLTMGFRYRNTDVCGVADAVVKLQHTLVSDAVQLCHHYFVWTPYDVEVIVRGDVSVKSDVRLVTAKVGNSEWRATFRVYEKSHA